MSRLDALLEALRRSSVTLSVGDPDERLATRSYRWLEVRSADGDGAVMPICDELGEARDSNPALLLHFALFECEVFEEEPGIDGWCAESGFDPTQDWVHAAYASLGEASRLLRRAVGAVKPLTTWDFSLNAGEAQRLRTLDEALP
ncbi:MAG: hypothetical protein AAF389_09340 [Gemmatimonadota bacterium]